MKNLIIGFGITILTIITAFTLLGMNDNQTKQNVLTTSTRNAAYQTVNECFREDAVPIESNTAMVNRFYKNLAYQLNTDDKINVKILAANYKTGILSVYVTQTYKNIGHNGTVTTRQTVIYDSSTY